MRTIKGDIWEEAKKVNGWVIVPTNGYINARNECVMGRGLALQAKEKFPRLPKELAYKISISGNQVYIFPEYKVITFPVKYVWFQKAEIKLIERSCEEFLKLLDIVPPIFTTPVFIPHVGCGNGGLDWLYVRRIILWYFDELVDMNVCDVND